MSDETELNKMFDLTRRTPPEPSPDFMARILSDADAMQPASLGVLTETATKRGIFRDMFSGLGEAIGGWPAFAGLATAAVTGVWIGISPPQLLIEPFGTVLGTDSSALSEVLEYGDGFDFTLFKG
jgi:hypothetical protein